VDDKDEEGNESNGNDDANDGVCGSAAATINGSISAHTNLDDLKLIGQFIAVSCSNVIRPLFHSVKAVVLAVLIVNFKVTDEDIIDAALFGQSKNSSPNCTDASIKSRRT